MGIQPDFGNKTWDAGTGPGMYCWENPHAAICAQVPNYYQYRIWLAPNALFLAIFLACWIAHLVTVIVTRRAVAFTVAFMLGLTCEVLGYVGRILSYNNQWDENGFLMQICCLTIGPAFMAAGVYLCLRRIVTAFGAENSRIPPQYYTRIFIPCDVISLILQAAGGAMASLASNQGKSVDLGDNIMIAGLSFQVITLVIFSAAVLDFALRTNHRHKALGSAALDQNPTLAALRSSRRFKTFLFALGLATFCILWRSAFRVAELSEGWTGPIMGNQKMFIGFEGVLIVVAVVALNIFHPAWCIRELMNVGGLTGLWFTRGRKGASSSAKSLTDSEREGKVQPMTDSA